MPSLSVWLRFTRVLRTVDECIAGAVRRVRRHSGAPSVRCGARQHSASRIGSCAVLEDRSERGYAIFVPAGLGGSFRAADQLPKHPWRALLAAVVDPHLARVGGAPPLDRKSTRLNSSHVRISY